MYRKRYHRTAKQDIQKCRDTYAGPIFPDILDRWLTDLAAEAETKEWRLSVDVADLLNNMERAEELVRQWPTVWQRFWNASFRAKLKAAHLALTGRPPYEPRGSVQVFTVFSVDCEVTVLYVVDHVAKEVIFMAFDGLPMQGYE